MFDFAWSEIALIAAVALIAIGPKDMPAAIRGITNMIKKARRMAAEFQTHVDEMVRDANLDEVRNQFNEIRNFDVKGHIERAVNSDGSLRSTFATNPLEPTISGGRIPDHEGGRRERPPVRKPRGGAGRRRCWRRARTESGASGRAGGRDRDRGGTCLGTIADTGLHPTEHDTAAWVVHQKTPHPADGRRTGAAGFHSARGRVATPIASLRLRRQTAHSLKADHVHDRRKRRSDP